MISARRYARLVAEKQRLLSEREPADEIDPGHTARSTQYSGGGTRGRSPRSESSQPRKDAA